MTLTVDVTADDSGTTVLRLGMAAHQPVCEQVLDLDGFLDLGGPGGDAQGGSFADDALLLDRRQARRQFAAAGLQLLQHLDFEIAFEEIAVQLPLSSSASFRGSTAKVVSSWL